MERLSEKLKEICLEFYMSAEEKDLSAAAIERLAHYEDLEEQGRLVELPCKVGDTVYIFHRRIDGSDCVREAEFWWSDIPQLNKTVFLSRAEAEAALAASAKEGCAND